MIELQETDPNIIIKYFYVPVLSRRRWSDLDEWASLETDDLCTTIGVGLAVSLCEKLQDVDPRLGLGRDPVLDVDLLQVLGPTILPTEEEGPELLSNHTERKTLMNQNNHTYSNSNKTDEPDPSLVKATLK